MIQTCIACMESCDPLVLKLLACVAINLQAHETCMECPVTTLYILHGYVFVIDTFLVFYSFYTQKEQETCVAVPILLLFLNITNFFIF